MELVGSGVKMQKYVPPRLAEYHRESPAGVRWIGSVTDCSWRRHTASQKSCATYPSVDKLPDRPPRQAQTASLVGNTSQQVDVCLWASVACSIRMQGLQAARLARPVMLRAVNQIATNVSKWTTRFDSMVRRRMVYI